ncbi:inner nuclear membrane protein enriched at telomere/subtelomere region [Metarhizium acridum]|nr:inner nuclear membrane protein enriched at telomere/subtelomere region [Metarhizium acridum]
MITSKRASIRAASQCRACGPSSSRTMWIIHRQRRRDNWLDLVNDHVLSQAAKLRAQRAQAKRSSLGFVNAGSAEDSNIWDEHDTRSRHSSMRRSMSPRKSSSRIKTEPEEPEPNISAQSAQAQLKICQPAAFAF